MQDSVFHPGESLTVHEAKTVLEQGLCAIEAGQREINLGSLSIVDSSAVAVMLMWQRTALKHTAPLMFKQTPDKVRRLIQLYGVTELLSLDLSSSDKKASG